MFEPEWSLRIMIGYAIISVISGAICIFCNVDVFLIWCWCEIGFTILSIITAIIVEVVSSIRYNKYIKESLRRK